MMELFVRTQIWRMNYGRPIDRIDILKDITNAGLYFALDELDDYRRVLVDSGNLQNSHIKLIVQRFDDILWNKNVRKKPN